MYYTCTGIRQRANSSKVCLVLYKCISKNDYIYFCYSTSNDVLQETAKLILGNRFAIFIKTKSQFENTLRFREKKACLELTCTCINIVCHCSVLQEECWWNCHVNIPRKKNVLPSFNVACFSAFVTYGLYRKQKHSHFLCKLLSIFSHFLNLLQGFVDILIYIFSLSL